MYLLMVILLVLCFYLSSANSFDRNLVKDFLAYKHTRRVVIFGCDEELSAMGKVLMEAGLYVQLPNFPHEESDRVSFFSDSYLSESATIVADISCPTFLPHLEQGTTEYTFNSSYSWLLLANYETPFDVIPMLERSYGLRLDSDVTLVQEANDGSYYHLVDLYSSSNRLRSPVRMNLLGHWKNDTGLHIIPGFNKNEIRKKFDQLALQGLLEFPEPVANYSEIEIDQTANRYEKANGVPGHVKYHLSLMQFLQEVHNFSVTYEPMDDDFMNRTSRFDVVGSGVLQSSKEKPLDVTILHQSWTYNLGFIFRLTPEVNGVTRAVSALSPFTDTVWCAVLLVIALVLAALQLMCVCHHAKDATQASNHFLIDMIGLVAQQGTTESSSRLPVRLALYAVLAMNFLLYNFYSASIVGELLSGINEGPKSIEQLVKCPLSVVFHNDSYNRALPKDEEALTTIHKLYQKKFETSSLQGATSVPVYADVATAVRLLKQGGFAFHCELTEAFRAISEQFDADEVCELRTMQGLFSKLRLMSFVLPKGSMYTEQFKITLTRATELGIIRRLLGKFRNEMPACQNGPLVQPVVMAGVATPFSILAAGIVCSTFILVVEKAVNYIKQRRLLVETER